MFNVGYDLQAWNDYSEKKYITADISSSTNSQTVICGMSGSGKSYFLNQLFAKLVKAEPNGEFYFADFKGDDSFAHLRDCKNYYSYKNTIKALDIVHEKLQQRMSGIDKSRNQITLIFDEYVANILSLLNEYKKHAQAVMNKVSELLMMGRSMCVRLIVSCQRPDAAVFNFGSRLNYEICIILGKFNKSIYDMLMPEHIDAVKMKIDNHNFGCGEGSCVIGSDLHFIKVGEVENMENIKRICKQALS